MFMYTTPTFIPFRYSSPAAFNDCYSELMAYTALTYSYGLVSTMHFNSKAMPTTNNN